MKKLIVIIVTFIFIFESTGYGLRAPLIFQNNASSRIKLSSADLIGTPVYTAFGIIDRTKTYDVQVDLRSPDKRYKANSIFDQLGKGFAALNDNDYVAIGLEVLYNGFSNYVVFVDRKSEVAHKIYRMEPDGVTFGLNSQAFLYKVNIYPEYIQLDLIGLWVPELRGKKLMHDTFDVLARRLKDVFGGMRIIADARHPAVIGWFEKYFNGQISQIMIVDSRNKKYLYSSNPEHRKALVDKLWNLKVFTIEERDKVLKAVNMFEAMRDILATRNAVVQGKMRPWQYLLYRIIETGKGDFRGYCGIIMEGRIPAKAEETRLASNNEVEKLDAVLKSLGIKDLDSDYIKGVYIKTWCREHRIFSHMPPLRITTYLNWDDYRDFINKARVHRRLNEVKKYILSYGIELYQAEDDPGYQKLIDWLNSLERTCKQEKVRAKEEERDFKAKFVDYLTGRAGPHIATISRLMNNISPLEWAAQGRFFWQVHERRHGLLFGEIDISGKSIGDLPLFPVDDKGRLDQGLIQWMFQKDNIPPLEYYQAKKVSLRELLAPKKENETAGPVQLELNFSEIAGSL